MTAVDDVMKVIDEIRPMSAEERQVVEGRIDIALYALRCPGGDLGKWLDSEVAALNKQISRGPQSNYLALVTKRDTLVLVRKKLAPTPKTGARER